MEIRFNGRTLFLTGGSGGIGREIAGLFAENGARVIAPGHEELDLSDSGSICRYCEAHAEISPDILIHCAGVNDLAGVNEITPEILERAFRVNCHAPALLMNALCGGMRERRWGRIVFVSSLYAIVSRERRIAYSASKHALSGLMKAAALELAPEHILVNSVAPGYVATEMTRKNLTGQELAAITANIPTGRLQEAREIAEMTAFLCSDYNRSITGQLIAVDGGFTCR